jgi:hypothetical protein
MASSADIEKRRRAVSVPVADFAKGRQQPTSARHRCDSFALMVDVEYVSGGEVTFRPPPLFLAKPLQHLNESAAGRPRAELSGVVHTLSLIIPRIHTSNLPSA